MTRLRDDGRSRILSSVPSGSNHWPELSEFEFGLIVSWHAFERWVVRCMRAAGLPDLGLNDVLVLHQVHHRGREKRLADICFTLGYEDTHVVTYALRKLAAAGLVNARKVGKEMRYSTTAQGDGAIDRYRRLRERCLLDGEAARFGDARLDGSDGDTAAVLSMMARRLRAASGWYDQAARAASSL
ncbi:MAG: winged helix DNA-binding protein [Burkholderiaceae bacterium]